MTVLQCPECTSSQISWSELADHVFEEHFRTSSSAESMKCPSCSIPVSAQNVLYHLSCLTSISPKEVWAGLPQDGRLCPICGQACGDLDSALSHIKSHANTELMNFLGQDLNCTVCGETGDPDNAFSGHLDCLSKVIDTISETGKYECPYCEQTAPDKGGLEWHIWRRHFDSNGFSATCPGCGDEVNFGDLKQHLLCKSSAHGPAAAKLFKLDIRECFVCDLSVHNPHVLRQHIKNTHLHLIERIGKCTECGDSLDDGSITLHYPCLAAALGSGAVLDEQPSWLCPICNGANSSKDQLISHLTKAHELELFEAGPCDFCGAQLTDVSAHTSCLRSSLNPENPESSVVDFPDVLLSRPSEIHHEAEHTLSSEGRRTYYKELKDFVEREREAARNEAWQKYDDLPLQRLKSELSVVPELVSIGNIENPDVDIQFVFERPIPDDETNPDDLTERFGIYPRQKVIIGANQDLPGLPLEAGVTFVDNQTIGITPDPTQNYTQSELESAFANDDAIYHVVELLTPLPFDRKRDAIKATRYSSELDEVVTGSASPTEFPVDIDSIYTGKLNSRQKQAAARALGNPDICCIHGPPGTGKTRTLTAIVELAVARGDRVLACAHSNQATDNLLVGSSTIEDPDESSLHNLALRNRDIKMARVGSHSDNPVVEAKYQDSDPSDADIVGATASAAAELDRHSFDLVIVDEATQADQPATFIPLLRSDNIVLAGDHKQLPPYCSDETAREQEMHASLFEHLLETYGDRITSPLRRQYRMNEAIAAFPNQAFYEGNLSHGEKNRSWQIQDLKPCVGHDISSYEETEEGSKSKYNPGEAEVVAQQVRLLQIHEVESNDIGIITPYRAQISEIAASLREGEVEDPEQIDIKTIDSYQGAERDAIIISFVRSNKYNASGFLTFPDEGKRRLNVALTRAKKRLVLIGDFDTLGNAAGNQSRESTCAEVYRDLFEYLDENEWLKSH